MSKFNKFILTANRGPENALQIPFTVLNAVSAKANELLADGYTVEVVPFTPEEWGRTTLKTPDFRVNSDTSKNDT